MNILGSLSALVCALLLSSCSLLGLSSGTDSDLLRELQFDIQDTRDLLDSGALVWAETDPDLAARFTEASNKIEPIAVALQAVIDGGGGASEGDVLKRIDDFLLVTQTIHWSADPDKNARVVAIVSLVRVGVRKVRRRLGVEDAPPEPAVTPDEVKAESSV